MGFFAEAGPLQLFVSNHLIPEDFEFDTTNDPCYVTADGDQKIVSGCEVRLRIVGTRVDANEIVSSSLDEGVTGTLGQAPYIHTRLKLNVAWENRVSIISAPSHHNIQHKNPFFEILVFDSVYFCCAVRRGYDER